MKIEILFVLCFAVAVFGGSSTSRSAVEWTKKQSKNIMCRNGLEGIYVVMNYYEAHKLCMKVISDEKFKEIMADTCKYDYLCVYKVVREITLKAAGKTEPPNRNE